MAVQTCHGSRGSRRSSPVLVYSPLFSPSLGPDNPNWLPWCPRPLVWSLAFPFGWGQPIPYTAKSPSIPRCNWPLLCMERPPLYFRQFSIRSFCHTSSRRSLTGANSSGSTWSKTRHQLQRAVHRPPMSVSLYSLQAKRERRQRRVFSTALSRLGRPPFWMTRFDLKDKKRPLQPRLSKRLTLSDPLPL